MRDLVRGHVREGVAPVAHRRRDDQRDEHDPYRPREPPATELLAEQDQSERGEQRQTEREHQDPVRRVPPGGGAEPEPQPGDQRPRQQEAPGEPVRAEGAGECERARHERASSAASSRGTGRGRTGATPPTGSCVAGTRRMRSRRRPVAARSSRPRVRRRRSPPRRRALSPRARRRCATRSGPRGARPTGRSPRGCPPRRRRTRVRDRAAPEDERRGEGRAAGPARERRGRGEERGGEHEVRDVAAAEEGRPRAGEQPRGEPRRAVGASGPAPGRAPRRRGRSSGPSAYCNPASAPTSPWSSAPLHRADQRRRARALARHRDAAELGHASPPQVDRARRARPATGSRGAASATGTRANEHGPEDDDQERGRGRVRTRLVRARCERDRRRGHGRRHVAGRPFSRRCYHRAPCSIASSSPRCSPPRAARVATSRRSSSRSGRRPRSVWTTGGSRS